MNETGVVELFCTCGARLVEDALFCHRCGRALRALTVEPIEPEPEIPEPTYHQPIAAPPPVAAPEVNFRNAIAVRVSFLAASLTYLLMGLTASGGGPLQMVLPLLLTAVGGAWAVYLYHRRTAAFPLSIRSGAKVGWMTGVFAFAISTVFLAVAMMFVANNGGLAELFKTGNMQLPQASMEELHRMLENPLVKAALVLIGLIFQFMLMTLLGSLGGALSAKLLDRREA